MSRALVAMTNLEEMELSAHNKRFDGMQSGGGGYKIYSKKDVDVWLKNVGNSGSGKDCVTSEALAMFERIETFCSSTDSRTTVDSLIDDKLLNRLGLDNVPIRALLQTYVDHKTTNKMTAWQRRTVPHLALYINSFGAENPQDIERLVKMFYSRSQGTDECSTASMNVDTNDADTCGRDPRQEDRSTPRSEENNTESRKRRHDQEASAAIGTKSDDDGRSTTFWSRVGRTTVDDVHEATNRSLRDHLNTAAVRQSVAFTNEELGTVLDDIINQPLLDTERVLVELGCQHLEPCHDVECFLVMTDDFPSVDQGGNLMNNDDVVDRLLTTLKSQSVSYNSEDVADLSTDLLSLVMPTRFRLESSDFKTALDVVIGVLCGGDLASVRAFYEIIKFTDFGGITSTDDHLEIIQRNLENIDREGGAMTAESLETLPLGHLDQSRGHLLHLLKREFGRQACFVLFMDLCRRFLANANPIKHVKMGCVYQLSLEEQPSNRVSSLTAAASASLTYVQPVGEHSTQTNSAANYHVYENPFLLKEPIVYKKSPLLCADEPRRRRRNTDATVDSDVDVRDNFAFLSEFSLPPNTIYYLKGWYYYSFQAGKGWKSSSFIRLIAHVDNEVNTMNNPNNN